MKVSIILPLYNVEKYIRTCIESLINQTHRDLEIIFVNDATPDSSMQIVQEYSKIDERIIIINNPRNMGPMMSRENGYKRATGDYIIFADPDDSLPVNAVEILLKKIVETDADIVSGGYIYKRNDGIEETHTFSLPYGNTPKDVYHALLEDKYSHVLWGKIYKCRLFTDYEYITFDKATNGEDACLFYQIVKNTKKIEVIENCVYLYQENLSSSTHGGFSLNQIESIIQSNYIRYNICKNYTVIATELERRTTWSIMKLFNYGHEKKEVFALLSKYNMDKYGTWTSAIKYLSLSQMLILLKYKYF